MLERSKKDNWYLEMLDRLNGEKQEGGVVVVFKNRRKNRLLSVGGQSFEEVG